jgi:hypothetical protein
VLTYAEVHYRPLFLPSMIFMKYPEIVCDAPTRVEPGKPVPVFIIIKDAHRFPIIIESVILHITYDTHGSRIARFPYDGLRIDTPVWWDSLNIIPEYSGTMRIIPTVLIRHGKTIVSVVNDNYRGTSHSPLIVLVSSDSFPGKDGWYQGDIHCHTISTSDEIEFGAPLEAMAHACDSIGLDWIAVTDHSYDLAATEDSLPTNESHLTRWHLMREKVNLLRDTLSIIPGEEVTCRTSRGENCHMLVLNASNFISGSGDSGKQVLATQSELSIKEAIAMCRESGGIACAAHPLKTIPLLEKLILNRGKWSPEDIETEDLTALQIHNGTRDSGFSKGMRMWREMLLKGKKIYVYGGSDAHGDMNIRRTIGIPFYSVRESREHTFGWVRTVVHSQSKHPDDIFTALKNGHAIVTEGPFIDLTIMSGGMGIGPGGCVPRGTYTIRAEFFSSSEFQYLNQFRLIAGIKGELSEQVIATNITPLSHDHYLHEGCYDMGKTLYIRAECYTQSDRLCFTNPIWFE